MADPAHVSIILVNWNGSADTVECVRSCFGLTYPSFDIVVVDNGSADDSLIDLRTEFDGDPRVTLIDAGENLGFAGGNNKGIQYALDHGAQYVWLLNNDTVVDPQALTTLVDAAHDNPTAGMLGSKIYYYDDQKTLWFAGGRIDEKMGHSIHIGENERDIGQYDQSHPVEYITGCSLLIPTDVIRSIGPMGEDYFLYWEEVDWAARAHEMDLESIFVPSSVVFHKVSASFGNAKPLQMRYEVRNRLTFHKRYHPERLNRIRYWLVRQMITFARHRQWKFAMAYARGLIDFQLHRMGRIS